MGIITLEIFDRVYVIRLFKIFQKSETSIFEFYLSNVYVFVGINENLKELTTNDKTNNTTWNNVSIFKLNIFYCKSFQRPCSSTRLYTDMYIISNATEWLKYRQLWRKTTNTCACKQKTLYFTAAIYSSGALKNWTLLCLQLVVVCLFVLFCMCVFFFLNKIHCLVFATLKEIHSSVCHKLQLHSYIYCFLLGFNNTLHL